MHQNIANGQSRDHVSPTGVPGNGHTHDREHHMSLGAGTQGSKLPEVGELPEAVSLDRVTYLALWREVFRRPPPKNISTGFMQKAIAFERQCKSESRATKQALRRLKRIAKGSARATHTAALSPGTPPSLRLTSGRMFRKGLRQAQVDKEERLTPRTPHR